MTSIRGVCSMVVFFNPQLLSIVLIFFALRFFCIQSASQKQEQHCEQPYPMCCCSCEEWGVLGKGWTPQKTPFHPRELCWLRNMRTVVLWWVHKLMQRQITLPSRLPKLKTETGSTSSTRICSRFKQMHNGRCTLEFRSGRQERSTAQSHRL